MKNINLFFLTVGLIITTSCGGEFSPSDLVKKSLDYAIDLDLAKSFKFFVTKDGKPIPEEKVKKMIEMADMAKKDGKSTELISILSYQILDEEIAKDGKTAVVKVKLSYSNGTVTEERFDLMNIENNWRIIYNIKIN
jgi:hypothetical protein